MASEGLSSSKFRVLYGTWAGPFLGPLCSDGFVLVDLQLEIKDLSRLCHTWKGVYNSRSYPRSHKLGICVYIHTYTHTSHTHIHICIHVFDNNSFLL